MPRKNQAQLAQARLGAQDLSDDDQQQQQGQQQQLLGQDLQQRKGRRVGGRRRSSSRSFERPHRGEFGHRKNAKRIQQGKNLASRRLGKQAKGGRRQQGQHQAAANIE